MERVPYELCVLRSLPEAVRRREVWVAGANRWRKTRLPSRSRPSTMIAGTCHVPPVPSGAGHRCDAGG